MDGLWIESEMFAEDLKLEDLNTKFKVSK